MRSRRVVWLALFVVPSLACKDNPATQTLAGAASAQAQAAAAVESAQAMASAAAQEAMAAAAQGATTTVTGKIHSVGGELGTWDVALSTCASGETAGFYGVDFYVGGSDDLRLRYVHDEANGDVVKIGIPSKKGSLLVPERSACSIVEGAVEKTNFTSWTPKGNIRHLDGHVKFDCKHSGGKGRVSGEATFAHCH
jgi:hypothetical protein